MKYQTTERFRVLRARAITASVIPMFAGALALAACSDSGDDAKPGSDAGTGGSSASGGSGGDDSEATGGSDAGGSGGSDAGGSGGSDAGTGGDAGAPGMAGAAGGAGLASQCTVTVPATSSPPYAELCEIEGDVRHVRIEGIYAPPSYNSAQLLFGLDGLPASTNPTLEAGELQILFYAGAKHVGVSFGDVSSTLSSTAEFFFEPSTACLDVHPGSESSPPHTIIWVDGQNGADCDDFDSLTLETSYAREIWWGGEVTGAINDSGKVYFRQPAGEAVVTLFDTPAVDEVPPFGCTAEIGADVSGYVELCAIDGPVRHVRIEGLHAPATHKSSQVLFGFEGAPESKDFTVGEGQFQTLFYGGGSTGPGMAQPSLFHAHFGSADLEVSPADFVLSPSTVCFDLHDGSEEAPPYFVLWVDGVDGADCDDASTLTLETASADELLFDGPGAVDKSTPVYFLQSAATAATVTLSSVVRVSEEDVAAPVTVE